jgi:hypothetical protein
MSRAARYFLLKHLKMVLKIFSMQPTQVSVIKSHQSSPYPKFLAAEPYQLAYVQGPPTPAVVAFDSFSAAADSGGSGTFTPHTAVPDSSTDAGSGRYAAATPAMFAAPHNQMYQ